MSNIGVLCSHRCSLQSLISKFEESFPLTYQLFLPCLQVCVDAASWFYFKRHKDMFSPLSPHLCKIFYFRVQN